MSRNVAATSSQGSQAKPPTGKSKVGVLAGQGLNFNDIDLTSLSPVKNSVTKKIELAKVQQEKVKEKRAKQEAELKQAVAAPKDQAKKGAKTATTVISVDQARAQHGILAAMEQKYPEGQCTYCMKTGRQLMPIPCGLQHRFCDSCLYNMIKITRIKKGLYDRFVDIDAIKCPKCNEISTLDKVYMKELASLRDTQVLKDKLRAQKAVNL